MKTLKTVPEGYTNKANTSDLRKKGLAFLGIEHEFTLAQKALHFLYLFRRFGPPSYCGEKTVGDWFIDLENGVSISVWVSFGFNFQSFSGPSTTAYEEEQAAMEFIKELKNPVARRDVIFNMSGESNDWRNEAPANLDWWKA